MPQYDVQIITEVNGNWIEGHTHDFSVEAPDTAGAVVVALYRLQYTEPKESLHTIKVGNGGWIKRFWGEDEVEHATG